MGGCKTQDTLKYRGETKGCWKGCGWGMEVKEGTCDEHGVVYVSEEPLASAPEANTTVLLTNWN